MFVSIFKKDFAMLCIVTFMVGLWCWRMHIKSSDELDKSCNRWLFEYMPLTFEYKMFSAVADPEKIVPRGGGGGWLFFAKIAHWV